ncbi:Protein of unknown function [Bacillus cereus]|nr:Protein of unknown function [Bacillus cereus]SCN34651.1 Protein of unknown function [Bacillus wiedmannii]
MSDKGLTNLRMYGSKGLIH